MTGGTGMLQSSSRRPWRDLASDPPPINPVIPAAGGSYAVTVGLVDYVARWAGYDTEKCIEKALKDGVIELDHKSRWGRDHDVYRFTAKGRRQSDVHIQDVFKRSARVARADYEEDMRKRARAGQAAGPGRPPPLPPPPAAAARKLIQAIRKLKRSNRQRRRAPLRASAYPGHAQWRSPGRRRAPAAAIRRGMARRTPTGDRDCQRDNRGGGRRKKGPPGSGSPEGRRGHPAPRAPPRTGGKGLRLPGTIKGR